MSLYIGCSSIFIVFFLFDRAPNHRVERTADKRSGFNHGVLVGGRSPGAFSSSATSQGIPRERCHDWILSVANGFKSVHPIGHIIRISFEVGVIIL